MGFYLLIFLVGWFLFKHVSIKVKWWLIFAIEISTPFNFVPSSSMEGFGCCSVSFGLLCLMVGMRSVYCCLENSFQVDFWSE